MTRPFQSGDLPVMAKSTDLFTYSECGWFCVRAMQGDRTVIHVHFKNAEDFYRTIGLAGYSYTGQTDRRRRRRQGACGREVCAIVVVPFARFIGTAPPGFVGCGQ